MQCIRVLFFSLLTTCVFYKSTIRALTFNPRQPRWVVDDLGCVTPEDKVGICSKISVCSYVLDLLEDADYANEADREILKPYQCGVDKYGGSKVCCPIIREEKRPAHNNLHHENLKLLPKNCGTVQAWGIYTGNQSNLFEFGWSALLKYEKSGDPYLCGGTLINDRYILTAAQCVRNRFKLIGVRLGELDIRTERDCTEEYSEGKITKICGTPPQDFDVSIEDATVHPEYNSRTHEHDIALIRLRHSADITVESVDTICLPITKEERDKEYRKYTALGWGATEYGLGSSVLMKVVTESVEKSKCRSFHAELDDDRAAQREYICTYGELPEAFCAGDYGGPLMGYYHNGRLKTIQYGIVSLRPPICQNIGAPTAYTKVSPYVEWILDNIKP